MKWTVTLVAETEPRHVQEHSLTQIEREDTNTPAFVSESLATKGDQLSTHRTLKTYYSIGCGEPRIEIGRHR
jgi:hypothetical protein